MSVRDQIATDYRDVLMNTDDFAETVAYKQGAQRAMSITAVLVNPEDKIDTFQTTTVRLDYAEWAIRKAEFAGLVPRKGDRITLTRDSAETTYEVQPDGDKAAVEWLEPEVCYLLRSKKVA